METGTAIDIAGMYALPRVDTQIVNGEENKHRPMPDSPEEKTFTLDALLVQAKVEPNDCEIHLEFAQTTMNNAKRVIVELTPDAGFSSDDQKVLRPLPSC